MPKPRPLGNTAVAIVSSVTDCLAQSQQELFDAVALIYAGDKDAAASALKRVSRSNMTAHEALTLLRAGQVREAEEALLDAHIPAKGIRT